MPTSAFRRKAGLILLKEERKIVGLESSGKSDGNSTTKETKKRKRPRAADWDAVL